MTILNKIKRFFVPDSGDSFEGREFQTEPLQPGEITANDILNAITTHFNRTINVLSTPYNFLYHTSFTIYLKADNYQEISDGFHVLALSFEQKLREVINKNISERNLNDYTPHSNYWQFQLVNLPPEAILDGSRIDGDSEQALIQINSTLFPPVDNRVEHEGMGRIVSTVHGVNTLRQIHNCINSELLNKIDLYERDRVMLNLRLSDDEKPSVSAQNNKVKPQQKHYATLVAEDGHFLDGTKVIHTVAITKDEVHITGRSSSRQPDSVQIVRADSDRVLSPHIMIRRDATSGKFSFCALSEATVCLRSVEADADTWHLLPNNSTIILPDNIQIRFNIVKK